MAYLQNALFNIKLQGGKKTFNQGFSKFNEIMIEFANSNIIEFLPEFKHPSNAPFFEQLKFYQTFLKSNQFESMTPSIKDDREYWENVIGYAECSNPHEVFIIAQLAHFISKRLKLESIVFGIGCEDIFTRIIFLKNGKIERVHEEIMDDEQENEDCFQMTLDELASLFGLLNNTFSPNKENIIEVDDNIQSDVKIGSQVWMSKNLDVEKFRNGDLIPYIESNEEWEEAGKNGQPAYCYFGKNPQNGEIYGKLYNSYAVNDPRGLAPEGWNIPNHEEWNDLIIFLGGEKVAGGKLKSSANWNTPNYGELNKSGFSALPAGFRNDEGDFYDLNGGTLYHCAKKLDENNFDYNNTLLFLISNINSKVEPILFYPPSFGASVRCLKNNTKIAPEGEHKNEDLENEILEVSIGSDIWMVKNLNVERFRNGDLIPKVESNEDWEEAGLNKQPAWCYYDNDPKNGEIYGKLYNWYAVNDPRGLAPKGWHIPGDEFENLKKFLGKDRIAGGKMKSKNFWNMPKKGTKNESGFTALGGGLRNEEAEFEELGGLAVFWSSIDENYAGSECAMTEYLYNDNTQFIFNMDEKSIGASVRCVKD